MSLHLLLRGRKLVTSTKEGESGEGPYAVAAVLAGAGAVGVAVAWTHFDWMVVGLVWCGVGVAL